MDNLWSHLQERSKQNQKNNLGLGLLGTNTFTSRRPRWHATLWGQGNPSEEIVKLSASRDALNKDSNEMTITFYDCEKPRENFDLLILSLHDGCGYMVERWLYLAKVKKLTCGELDMTGREETWEMTLDTHLLKYEPLTNFKKEEKLIDKGFMDLYSYKMQTTFEIL